MSDHVLVINAGSSSLKYSVVDARTGEAAAAGLVERIGEGEGRHVHRGPAGETETTRSILTHEDALRAAIDTFDKHGPSLADLDLRAVGHRVVHGGSRFSASAPIDDALLAEVTGLVPLAPLHNPANLEESGSPAGSSPTCHRSPCSTPRSIKRSLRTPTPTRCR